MTSIRRMGIGLTVLTVALSAACETSTSPDGSAPITVPSLTLEARGDTARLTATVDGSARVAEWVSLDTDVATVTPDGRVTAVGAGTARMRATVGERSGTGIVTVLPPVDLELTDPRIVTDPNGETGVRIRLRNLGGRGFYRLEFWNTQPNGVRHRFLVHPEDVEAAPGLDIELGWSLVPEWVVLYAREPMASELIRAGCLRMDGMTGPCPSDLPDPGVTADSISVSPAAAVMDVGDTLQYVVRACRAGTEIHGRPVTWSTTSPEVISLGSMGRVLALRPGYGQVQATVDGISSAVALTVTTPEPSEPPPAPVFRVSIQPHRVRMWTGQTWGLMATTFDASMRELDGRPVAWSVMDDAVATVDGAGRVTGVGHGSTLLVASSEGVEGFARVDSYTRPEGRAELAFSGLQSASADPGTFESIVVTWADDTGTEYPGWIQVQPGTLVMDWSGGAGTYSQTLVLSTYIYENPGVRKVAEAVYHDEGVLHRWWDYLHGEEAFDFTSTVRSGLTYRGRWTLPGELRVEQPAGELAKRSYYFRLPL